MWVRDRRGESNSGRWKLTTRFVTTQNTGRRKVPIKVCYLIQPSWESTGATDNSKNKNIEKAEDQGQPTNTGPFKRVSFFALLIWGRTCAIIFYPNQFGVTTAKPVTTMLPLEGSVDAVSLVAVD